MDTDAIWPAPVAAAANDAGTGLESAPTVQQQIIAHQLARPSLIAPLAMAEDVSYALVLPAIISPHAMCQAVPYGAHADGATGRPPP